uniref:Uncharacterized protein n=1 Tax=Arundo donax TaxID=35708 RepID=A0A0A8ZX06_ARUDO
MSLSPLCNQFLIRCQTIAHKTKDPEHPFRIR